MKNDKQNDTRNHPADPIIQAARRNAQRDIAKDPELSIHKKNDDLDEGELARAGGDKNDLA